MKVTLIAEHTQETMAEFDAETNDNEVIPHEIFRRMMEEALSLSDTRGRTYAEFKVKVEIP